MAKKLCCLLLSLFLLMLPMGCYCCLEGALLFGLMIEIDEHTPGNLTDRDSVADLYRENEEAFRKAAETGSFEDLKDIFGVSNVYVKSDCVDIYCGGTGIAPSSSYYGIFYSEADDPFALYEPVTPDNPRPEGRGYSFSDSARNTFYVEPLGNHYFYYEAHY